MAAKFFTSLPLDGPDPECVQGHSEPALARGATYRRADPPRSAHVQQTGAPDAVDAAASARAMKVGVAVARSVV